MVFVATRSDLSTCIDILHIMRVYHSLGHRGCSYSCYLLTPAPAALLDFLFAESGLAGIQSRNPRIRISVASVPPESC